MKKIFVTVLIGLFPMLALADVTGVWQTEPNAEGVSGIVQVSACGDGYCGVLIGDTAGSVENSGKTVIYGMKTTDGVNFSGGSLTDPVEGKTYNKGTKLVLQGNVLQVGGCVFNVCRMQNWVRAQ